MLTSVFRLRLCLFNEINSIQLKTVMTGLTKQCYNAINEKCSNPTEDYRVSWVSKHRRPLGWIHFFNQQQQQQKYKSAWHKNILGLWPYPHINISNSNACAGGMSTCPFLLRYPKCPFLQAFFVNFLKMCVYGLAVPLNKTINHNFAK